MNLSCVLSKVFKGQQDVHKSFHSHPYLQNMENMDSSEILVIMQKSFPCKQEIHIFPTPQHGIKLEELFSKMY
jgi:hypothetical protein